MCGTPDPTRPVVASNFGSNLLHTDQPNGFFIPSIQREPEPHLSAESGSCIPRALHHGALGKTFAAWRHAILHEFKGHPILSDAFESFFATRTASCTTAT